MSNDIITDNKLKSELHSKCNEILRLVSIIISYLFWQLLALLLLFFVLFDVVSFPLALGQLSKLLTGLGLIGVAPIVLVVFSWRRIELFCSKFITSYMKKHLTVKLKWMSF